MPTVRDTLLGRARWYRAFKNAIRADKATEIMAREYIRPEAGSRVLDVGCGDGDIRPHLGDVDYTGVDFNADYLKVAKAHEDEHTRFINVNVAELKDHGLGPYDCAIAVGLLHHLDDAECQSLITAVHDALVPGGRFITFDPVFTPTQRTSARVLAALDRGRFVRDQGGYERLLQQSFDIDAKHVRNDLLPFPYSHAIFEARRR